MENKLTIHLVKTWREVMQLRTIWNTCISFMTRDQTKIGFFEQIIWWLRNRNQIEAFLIYDDPWLIAFGIIDGNEIMGGVTPSYRGKGIGKLIFSLMTKAVPKPAELEVLADNI